MVLYHVARLLGKTVAEVRNTMTPVELLGWIAYIEQERPFS